MNKRSSILLVLVVLVGAAACGTSDVPASPATAPGAAPVASTTKTVPPSQNVQLLVGRLQQEAANRPAVALPAERVFEALGRAGLALPQTRQYVGLTMQASYCAGGTTADHVVVAACEYPTQAAAQAGLDHMNHVFGTAAPHAQRVVHATTVVTITPPPGPDHDRIVERAFTAVRAL
ncbi:MAG TPA: hypothetical protein VFQ53_24675 [Kofleriaceae bacterium]|nr:hypothetical protein [Kofleriaceae bacterium]